MRKIFRSKEELFEKLKEGQIKKFKIDENIICLSRINNEVYAFELECPHAGADLSEGWWNKYGEVVCPLHNYVFTPIEGVEKSNRCRNLKFFVIQEKEQGLFIDLR